MDDDIELPTVEELVRAEVDGYASNNTASDNDDDGLDSLATAEAYDELYLAVDDACEEEQALSHTREPKILHGSGDSKLRPEDFISRTAADGFDSKEALEMLQHRYTMDYGRRSSGSRPASESDEYYTMFYLDMISIVGQPLRAITHPSSFFDNVTFTLQHWQAPYRSKHAIGNLPFELTYRTFRLATGASREIWFVVMHPVQAEVLELSAAPAGKRCRRREPGERSAMRRHHAEAMASYAKDIFLNGSLLGEGIEASWALGDRRTQNITFEKWCDFQTHFMEQWPAFVRMHAHDPYWADHQPAFHAYDHGANIEIEVKQTLEALPREVRLREDEDGTDSESSDDSEAASDEESQPRAHDGGNSDGRAADAGITSDGTQSELYTDGLEKLRGELEKKYNLRHILQVSYAIAADIHCVAGSASTGDDEQEEQVKEPLCLLADRTRMAAAYGSDRECTFYPLAFHPRYGNFSSKRPPGFLHDLYAVMRDNMSLQNDGRDVLSFDGFQGYSSGLKRAVRHRKEDLLARKGTATAALTLSPSEAGRSPAHIRAKNGKLLREIRGEGTAGQPEASIPFARERARIEAAILQQEMAFRMEQVVTINTAWLVPDRCNFFTVIKPIFQIMRFFRKEPEKYSAVLRRFRPAMFPGILCSFARLFETAFAEMERRFRAKGADGLDLALCESVAVLDRLGNYCFTGDPRVLPSTVLGPLTTAESIRKGAWPFVSPKMLDFRDARGRMDMVQWPRTNDKQSRPILLHVASLGYHYGQLVASNRHSQMWFSQLGGRGIRDLRVAVQFLEGIFREVWIPQTVGFVTLQLRRQLNRGARSGRSPEEHSRQAERVCALLRSWEEQEEPFKLEQYDRLFVDEAAGILGKTRTTSKSRQDFAREIYEACRSTKDTAGQAISTKHSTWFVILRSAIQHTKKTDIGGDDWINGLVTAMASAGVMWAPGSHNGRLTCKQIVKLAGVAKPKQLITAPPGSLKRAAMEADLRMKLEDEQPKRMRRQVIDFGCELPFKAIPRRILDGFAGHYKQYEKEDPHAANHYQTAHSCLVRLVGGGDERCDLMIMLALTVAASSVTPRVNSKTREFEAVKRRKEPERLAAALITRMLWFLQPEAFSSGNGEGIQYQAEMTKKMGSCVPGPDGA